MRAHMQCLLLEEAGELSCFLEKEKIIHKSCLITSFPHPDKNRFSVF